MKKLKYITWLLIILLSISSISVYAGPGPAKRNNIAPTIDLNVTPVKKPVDIVILTDYTGTKLAALNTQINSLKAQFSAVNVDPKFYIISDIKKIGTQNDQLYEFVRYGKFEVTYSSYRYYYNYGLEDSFAPYTDYFAEEWERTQRLISQYANLPARNPRNVYFTKSALQTKHDADEDREWYNITIKCANDPSQIEDGVIREYIYNEHITSNHHEYIYGSILNEVASVDSTWTVDEKISDVSYDIYSMDFARLSSIALRTGSDRHMIFLSDAAAKDYSKTFGDYFSFGELTDSVQAYIKDNGFAVYGVASDKARHTTLYPDKVKSIEPYGLFTIFRMENGDLLKLGNSLLAEQLSSGEKMYPEVITSFNLGSVKKTISDDDYTYHLMNDGTLKIGSRYKTTFVTETGLSDIKDIVSRGGDGRLWVLTNSGQLYRYEYGGEIFPMGQSGVIIDRIIADGQMFLTESGIPYGVFSFYDDAPEVWTHDRLERYRRHYDYYDDEGDRQKGWGYLGAVKDVAEYWLSYNYSGVIVLYTNNRIEQYEYFDDWREDNKYGDHYDYPGLRRNMEYPYTESNVASLSSTDYGVILHKTDGITRMVTCDVEAHEYWDSEDGVWYTRYNYEYCMNSKPIALNNITPLYTNFYGRNFYKDANDRLYMLTSSNAVPVPAGEAIVDMGIIGADVLKLVRQGNSMYILYNNGELKVMSYKNSKVTETIPYTDVKNMYASDWQIYLLKFDGSVLGIGYSNNGQLGITKINQATFINPFHNALDFDMTKTYYSLLDLFNEISNAKFYPAGGYATAFNDIYKNYNYSTSGNMYVVLGDSIKYESAYDDYENDPEYGRKWKIAHDPYHFDNSMGLSAYHKPNGFAANPPAKLDKVGKYVINLYARDNPKSNLKFLSDSNEDKNYYKWSLGNHNLTVYIHRKPVALQRITVMNNGNGTFTVRAYDAGSYDPDHSVTRADKGIAAREWRWRESTSTVWTAGQLNKSDCKPDLSYITQLRVKDIEGVWSDYTTITIDRMNPPMALFNIDRSVINISELLKVKDQSYPQSLSDITRWHWVVKKLNADGSVPAGNIQNAQFTNSNAGTGTLAGYDANVKTSYNSNGTGKYRVYLRVKDSNGLWSDKGTDSTTPADLTKYFSLDFEVDRPPTARFSIDVNPITSEEILKLKDQSYITGTSALARWQWIVKKLNGDGTVPAANIQNSTYDNSNNGTGAMAGYDVNVKTNYSDIGTGIYRIYLRVMNANGLWSDGGTNTTVNLGSCFYRDLEVKVALEIKNVQIQGYWNHWRGQIDMFGKQLTTEPHRFLSLEKVRITADVGGGADKLTIRFSPELESMHFTDPMGNVYSYYEQLGYIVAFPGDSTVALDPAVTENSVSWEYILPLAPSTVGWDDVRKRAPYSMTITAWKGSQSVSHTIDDIDITGNTYNLIYIQPAK